MILNRQSHVLAIGLMAAVFFSLAADTLAFENSTIGRWLTRDPPYYHAATMSSHDLPGLSDIEGPE